MESREIDADDERPSRGHLASPGSPSGWGYRMGKNAPAMAAGAGNTSARRLRPREVRCVPCVCRRTREHTQEGRGQHAHRYVRSRRLVHQVRLAFAGWIRFFAIVLRRFRHGCQDTCHTMQNEASAYHRTNRAGAASQQGRRRICLDRRRPCHRPERPPVRRPPTIVPSAPGFAVPRRFDYVLP